MDQRSASIFHSPYSPSRSVSIFSLMYFSTLSPNYTHTFESNLIWFNNNTDLIIFLCIYTSKRWLIGLLEESCLLKDDWVKIFNRVWDSFISLLSDKKKVLLSSKRWSNLWRTQITGVTLSSCFFLGKT